MPVYPLINNFTGGEMSPLLIGRVDLDRYGNSCQRMENMRAFPYGGAFKRSGLEHIYTTVGETRIKEFIYSTDTSYILAFSNGLLKIFNDGAYLSSSDIVTPYLSDEVFDLQFLQINDIMYITHQSHTPHKLSRVTSTTFTLEEVDFDEPPFLDLNATTTAIDASATTGTGITLNASAALFVAGHVGANFKIEHFKEASSLTHLISGISNSGPIVVDADWTLTTTGTWAATVAIERSYDSGLNWDIIASFSRASDGNVNYSSTEEAPAWLRVNITSYTSHTAGALARIEAAAGYIGGIVKVTGFTNSTTVTADVIVDLQSTDATLRWREGAWSDYRGYPKCVSIFQERIYYANSTTQPQRLWGSNVGDYDNFEIGSSDSDGISYEISDVQQNPIQWMLGERSLLIGSSSSQWTLDGGENGDPVTPSNVSVKRQPSNIGAEALQPVSLPGITLFLQRGGRKFRELSYQFIDNAYVAQDVTLLSEQITKSGIVQFATASHPDSIAYAVRGDGQLAVMVYERGQANGGAGNLVAWSRYTTEGLFKSVAVIPGSPEDEVWAVVKRTNDGVDYHCIERFRARASFLETRNDWFFLDSGRTTNCDAQISIGEIEKYSVGNTFVISGETYANYVYRVEATSHFLSTGDVVRITGSTSPVNGGTYKVVKVDNNFFFLGELVQDYPELTVSSITNANPGVAQISGAFLHDKQVVFIDSPAAGMVEIQETPLEVDYVSGTSYELSEDTTAYTPFSGTATAHALITSQDLETDNAAVSGGYLNPVNNTFSLPAYLDGSTVSVVGDGSPIGTVTAGGAGSSGGNILTELPDYYCTIHAGLPYSSYLQPNPVETPMQDGASSSKRKRVSKVSVFFNNTVGAEVGPDADNLEEIQFRSTEDLMDQAIPAFTGEIESHPKFDISSKANILITQSSPLNMEVLYIAPKMEFYTS
jgi:hypothetical protein